MAKTWYSYHTETPKDYFEEQYEIYMNPEEPSWRRYTAIQRMDTVFLYLANMPEETWAEDYVIDRSQKRLNQIRYAPTAHTICVTEERESTAFQHYFYIVEMYDRHGRLLWTKIGATKNFEKRMKQHYNYYNEVYDIKTLFVIDTQDIPAEEVENKVRTYLLKRYGRTHYIPNDRFTRKINLEELVAKIPACIQKLREAEIV